MKKLTLSIAAFVTLFMSSTANAQINVINLDTPETLVEDVLAGPGVTISNVEFNYSVPLATSVQTMVGFFDAAGTSFPIEKGVILATGNCALAVGPNDTGGATDNTGVAPDPSDVDLDAICTAVVNNECVLEFDFVPSGDSVIFNYIFASEEYPEYVGSVYNDVFGFFLSGPGIAGPYTGGAENIALIPGTATEIAINNLNNGTTETGPCMNCEYYVSNAGGLDVQYDAHTTVLQAKAEVICGETYHIKLALGDAGDAAWDSGVFLEAYSFASNGVSVNIASATGGDDITEGCDSAVVCFVRPSEEDTADLFITYEIGGTAINGTDYPFLDGDITMPLGEDTVCFYITPYADATPEGTETVTVSVSYLNECGDSVTTTGEFNIIDPLPPVITLTDTTIDCPTDSILITSLITGGVPPYTYSWSPSGGSAADAWLPGDIVGTTTYTLDVDDACFESASEDVDVTLAPAPEPTIDFNEDVFTICPAEGADIDATVIDPYSMPVTYLWSPTGETDEDITATPATDSWYLLTIDDGCYVVSDSVEIIIGDVDITDITVVDATDCPGAPTATPGSILIEPDDPSWTYEIVGYVPPQNSGFFPGLDGGINYVVTITNDQGCTTDTVIYVGLGDNMIDATFILDSLRPVSCYGYGDGGAAITNISGGLIPPYDVEWTHTSGSWATETGIPVGGGDDIDNLYGGTWTVTVTDGADCAWSYVFEIDEPDEFLLDMIWNAPTCYGFTDGSVTALTTGGNGENTVTITNDAGDLLNGGGSNTANTLGEGWYYVTVVDSVGCEVTGSVFVDDPDQIEIDLDITQPQCYGVPTGFAEVDTVINYNGDYDDISYFWNPNPNGTNGLGIDVMSQMGEGDYTLTVNDDAGCSMVFDFTITYPPELFFNELGYDPAYCRLFSYQSGNGVVYAAAGGGTPDYTYEWTNLGTGETTPNTTWGGLNPGEYEIKIVDDNGCILYQVIVLDSINPVASFDPVSDQFLTPGVCEGTAVVDVTFYNTSTGFANPNNPFADTTFFWHYGYQDMDWILSKDVNEVMDTTYYVSGVYPVCLVAQNKNGCTDTTCKDMIIHDPLIFNPINVFTPDGDGVNDIFSFYDKSQAVNTFNCVIVNRWGVKMYEMTDITDGWDGTDKNGSKVTDGVYFYTYEGEADDGTPFAGQGHITLLTNGKK